jgi:hypothetical protein
MLDQLALVVGGMTLGGLTFEAGRFLWSNRVWFRGLVGRFRLFEKPLYNGHFSMMGVVGWGTRIRT